MKKIISLLCVLALVLSISPMPVQAATGDTMKLSAVFLRTAEGKEGIFYGASFNLTQETLDNMDRYGLALTPKVLADDEAWTAAMDTTVLRSWYTDGLTAGKEKEVTSTSLVNIINISNDTMANNRNAATAVYVRPYVELKDGTFLYGDVGALSMKQVAQMVDAVYNTDLTDTQKRGLLGMYERFSSCMKGWGLTNIKNDYPNGTDKNGESLILQYRREKVVANMQAQADILWSFNGTEPVQYSRTPASSGLTADSKGNVYTLYPGRIYKGIPYTHGSGGIEVYYTMGKQNSDGVYVIDSLNSSILNGGSTNGSNADTGKYNVARMGNDCWDAISWAYESIGSSVTADQTSEVTPTYGMYPVGPYADELFDLFLSSTGILTTFNSVYANHFSGNSVNQQTIYESYAQMQPGDTLIHYVESAGDHALMNVSVNVVRNADGTIDPDQSTVTYIEQGFGNEKAQSVDFNIDKLGYDEMHQYNHDNGGILSDPANCHDCAAEAGYDKTTGIWTLNPGRVTASFTQLFDAYRSYYIPMTCEELRDPAAKISASRISDSKNNVNITGIYTGTLDATYRVSYITLDLFDAAGDNVNSATCFGIQNGLVSPFSLSRFVSDQTSGEYGSVLKGVPALQQKSYTYVVEGEYTYKTSATGNYYKSEDGNYVEITAENPAPEGAILYTRTEKTATATWLEAPDLPAGSYSFTMTCVLGNGYTKTFRSGFFVVGEGTTPEGKTATNMVFAD